MAVQEADNRPSGWFESGRRFAPGAALVMLALIPSSSPYIGDTMSYANSVVNYRHGRQAGEFHELWEFGHLLWRPLGALLSPLIRLVPDAWTTDESVKVAYLFLALSIVFAVGVGALCYDLVRRYAGWKVATVVTFGVSWANGFLMYALSGSSYITALFFAMFGLWLLVGEPRHPRRQVIAGLCAALAGLIWFPFILTIPALALLPWLWTKLPARHGLTAALRVGVPAAVCLTLVYAIGALAAGARSPSEIVDWYASASHGWQQTQQWKRAVTGSARLMLDLSRDGILLKRYALGDPFQTATFADLVRSSLWKIAVFYVFVGAVLWMGVRTAAGRVALLVSLVAAIPMAFFALVLFEPSSPERFLPLLPFIVLICAVSWRGPARYVAGAFFLALPLMNGSAFINGVSPIPAMMDKQMRDVSASADTSDLVVTVTFADPFPQWVEQRVFHPSLRQGRPATYQLIAPSEANQERWQQKFAERVMRQWEEGGEVWIRRGALSDRPDPMLQWVEGDHPTIRWAQIPAFLNRLEYDRVTSLADGFTRLARTGRTRDVLASVMADSQPR